MLLSLSISRLLSLISAQIKHIQITELDIRANEEMGGQLNFSRQGVEIKPWVKALHTDQYAQLFKCLRKHKDVVDVVTFWNLSDRDSWVGTSNYPLLFDKDLNKKEAYNAVLKFDPALDNASPIEDFKPSELNQPGQEYPMVNSQGYARFRVEAPQAKSVIVSLGLGGRGGTVLRKGKDGYWWGTTEGPMDEGFHYYHLTVTYRRLSSTLHQPTQSVRHTYIPQQVTRSLLLRRVARQLQTSILFSISSMVGVRMRLHGAIRDTQTLSLITSSQRASVSHSSSL